MAEPFSYKRKLDKNDRFSIHPISTILMNQYFLLINICIRRIFTIQTYQIVKDTFERKTRLAERFKQAGATPDNNLHIIIWEGKWLVVKEGSQRALGTYGSKTEATKKAM